MHAMDMRRYLLVLALITLTGWLSFIVVLFRLDPFTSTAFALPFFLGSVFFAASGTATLLGFYIRVWRLSGQVVRGHITAALRQGLFLGLFLDVLLLFSILRILTWWDALLVAAALYVAELYMARRG